eukprot:m.49657 g.49657  ORF g.49657 m.49657 type:complete len:181 (+) comp16180_c0_seq1:574-1116(+)
MPVHVQVNGRKYLIKGDAPTNSDMYLQVGQYSATAVTDFLWTGGDKDEEVANDRKYSFSKTNQDRLFPGSGTPLHKSTPSPQCGGQTTRVPEGSCDIHVESEVPILTRQRGPVDILARKGVRWKVGYLNQSSGTMSPIMSAHRKPEDLRGGGSLLHCDGQAGVGENFWGREQILPNSLGL